MDVLNYLKFSNNVTLYIHKKEKKKKKNVMLREVIYIFICSTTLSSSQLLYPTKINCSLGVCCCQVILTIPEFFIFYLSQFLDKLAWNQLMHVCKAYT
jgi:hypothetical protein